MNRIIFKTIFTTIIIANLLLPFSISLADYILEIPVTSVERDQTSRHLITVAKGNYQVFLSWRFFSSDLPSIEFRVYRSLQSDGNYQCLNYGDEIYNSTNFIDTVPEARTYYYVVRTWDGVNEGPNSNVAKVDAVSGGLSYSERYRWLNITVPNTTSSRGPAVGDLDGDGLLDYVILDENNVGPNYPNNTMFLRAYKNDGTLLWVYDTGYYFRQWFINGQWYDESGISVPFVTWDLDNDGKAEVIARTDNGPGESPDEINQTYLTIIKGGEPEVTTRIEIPHPTNIALQLEKHYDQNQPRPRWVNIPHYLSVAHLDGIENLAQIIVQIAVHDGERLVAYDVNPQTLELTQRWDFQSITGYDENLNRILTEGTGGSGTHGITIYDMDNDGKDEVFDGSTLLDDDDYDGDGAPEVLWTAYRADNSSRLFHPDVVIPGDILSDHPGLEVWFATEGRPTGVFLTDQDGLVIWEDDSGGHTHDGWVANLINDNELPGYELYGWDTENNVAKIFNASQGDVIYYDDNPNLDDDTYHSVIQWDEDKEAEVYYFLGSEKRIKDARFEGNQLIFDNGPIIGITPSWFSLRADIIGDYREEFIFSGNSNTRLQIYTNTESISTRKVSRWENLEYRKTAAKVGGSYWHYFGPINFNEEPGTPRVKRAQPQVIRRRGY